MLTYNYTLNSGSASTQKRKETAWKKHHPPDDLSELIPWALALPPTRSAVIAFDVVATTYPHLLPRKIRPKWKRKDKGIYTEDEVSKLIAASSGEPLGQLIPLLFGTGLRLGEALALEPDDLLPNSHLSVTKQVHELSGKLSLGPLKTKASRRQIFYSDAVNLNLSIRSRSGQFVRKLAVYRLWKRIHAKAQIEAQGRTPHTARHTHASILLARGCPIIDVSRRLGHASVAVTLQIYAHHMPGDDRCKAFL